MTAHGQPDWQWATVSSVEPVATDVVRITLDRPGYVAAPAGSHVDLRLPTARGVVTRSYSVVDSVPGRLTVSVLCTTDSRGGSVAAHALHIGDRIESTQPLQTFPLRLGAPSYVLVAAGIGITAILPMADLLRRSRADYTVVYAGQSRERMAYVERLQADHGDRLELRVSDEDRRINPSEIVSSVAEHPRSEHVELYVCGPHRLLRAVRSAWAAAALPESNLRFETFGGGGGAHEPVPFRIRLRHADLDTVVGVDESLLDALVRSGVPTMYDCRKGECGLCVMHVISVEGKLDHRDVYLSDAQKATGSLLVTCVSRVAASDVPAATIELAPT